MPNYPMTEVIASRDYVIERDSVRIPLRCDIGKPAPCPDDGRDWYCPFIITGAAQPRTYAVGIDSVQAILLAFSALHAILEYRAKGGTLTFVDGAPGTGMQLVLASGGE
jgi:uncharacterized protein DUF6968